MTSPSIGTGEHSRSARVPGEAGVLGALKKALEPARALEGVRVWYRPATGAWREVFPQEGAEEAPPAASSRVRVDEFPLRPRRRGPMLAVATEPPAEGVAMLVRQLVRAVLDLTDLEERERHLLDELGANWESLEALYELNTELRAADNPRELLDRLMHRKVLVNEGLSAAVYVEAEGKLTLQASNRECLAATLERSRGLVGKALAERRTQVINGREELDAVPDLEPQWRTATSVAVAPIATRHGLVGAFTVWKSGHKGAFDTPLLRLVEALGNQAAMIIEGDRLNRALRESERLRQEIEIASSIQQTLLLDPPPEDLPRLEVAAFTLASQRIDGDFCEFIRHQNGAVDVLVGDVMGKGVPAALLGAATKHHLVRAMAELASSAAQRSATTVPPDEVVSLAAGRLASQLIALERFVTLCYARVDAEGLRLELVDCGHTRTIWYHAATGECTFLHGENLPLGVTENEAYVRQTATLGMGDALLFYSDGVTEARNDAGEFFGEERLAECVGRFAGLSCGELLERIRAEVVTFSGGDAFADDFTSVAVRVREPGANQPLCARRAVFSSDVEQLTAMRSWTMEMAAQVPGGLGEEHLGELELALQEALANVVQHAYKNPGGRIELEADAFADRFQVRISDWGEPFDPTRVLQPSFDGSRESGFGVYIISHCMDHVAYWREPDGRNVMWMVKFRKPDPHKGEKPTSDGPEH
ncbi:MAG TPA: SpoIIE family protein phosphatase [Bryobacteraceae bacterium]|nr:SpoIIE family protein phosphatase [Bryobacteraceae bacterium]